MNKRYKKILNWGLAFDEDRVLKRMGSLAEKGWILKRMTMLKYTFEKEEPKQLIYSMDYSDLKEDGEEYFNLFKNSGWRHMCSYGPFHFFSAAIGTVPIYTDRESYLNKYKESKNISFKVLGFSSISLIITAAIYLFAKLRLENFIFEYIMIIAVGLSAAIVLPSLMMTIAYAIRFNKKKCI